MIRSMKRVQQKLERIKAHPVTQKTMEQLKPKKTFWSLISVALFFIVPEVVALIWGTDIKAYTQSHLSQPLPLEDRYRYKAIEMLFTDPSYFNLLFGIGLLVWAFF